MRQAPDVIKPKSTNVSILWQESATDGVATIHGADACSCFHVPQFECS